MTTREAKKIASLIPRQGYLENLEQLQYLCLKLNIDVDFDYVYFIEEVELLPIASIYGISLDEKNLYILRDIPKIIKLKATTSLRISCLFCIFKHSPQKTV